MLATTVWPANILVAALFLANAAFNNEVNAQFGSVVSLLILLVSLLASLYWAFFTFR